MINKKFVLFVIVLSYISALCSCNASRVDDVATTTPTSQTTPQPMPTEVAVIPSDKITFILLESKKNSLTSQYHINAFQELSNKGYNVSAMYANDNQDLTGVFTQLELEDNKYVFVADNNLKDYVKQYKQNTDSKMIFAMSETYWPIETGLSYAVKLYEYYYFSGIALGSKSETSVAGFFADEADAQTICCINAFALGMKSVNQDSTVLISWTQNPMDETALAQSVENLKYQNCDVFAYKQSGNLIETVCENMSLYYMSPYIESSIITNEKLVITPTINLSIYVESVLSQDISSSQFEFLGVENGVITFNVSKEILNDEIINLLYSVNHSITSTSYEVFTGPIYNEYGMVVPEGVALPETDIISMLWFVDNVIGNIPAG